MGTKDEYAQRLIEAVLKVADTQQRQEQSAAPVTRGEVRRQEAAEQEQAETGGGGVLKSAGAGLGLPMSPDALAREVGEAIREGFKLMTGDIVNVLKTEISAASARYMELQQTTPLEQTKQYARDLALAGEQVTPEKLMEFHQRAKSIGDRQFQAEQMAGKVGGLAPDFFYDAMEGAEEFWLKFARNRKKDMDQWYSVQRNDKLHED